MNIYFLVKMSNLRKACSLFNYDTLYRPVFNTRKCTCLARGDRLWMSVFLPVCPSVVEYGYLPFCMSAVEYEHLFLCLYVVEYGCLSFCPSMVDYEYLQFCLHVVEYRYLPLCPSVRQYYDFDFDISNSLKILTCIEYLSQTCITGIDKIGICIWCTPIICASILIKYLYKLICNGQLKCWPNTVRLKYQRWDHVHMMS